ncbi:unnamed protein product [Scytosiphon promiscuus]
MQLHYPHRLCKLYSRRKYLKPVHTCMDASIDFFVVCKPCQSGTLFDPERAWPCRISPRPQELCRLHGRVLHLDPSDTSAQPGEPDLTSPPPVPCHQIQLRTYGCAYW